MKLIDEILMDLVPYMDKVFLCPLSMQEVEAIEKIYGRKFPDYYRYFLTRVGIRQDFVFGLISRRFDFKDISEFISSNDYFQFGDNGGEDYWLLKFDKETDREVYEYDYYCNGEIVSTEKTFDSILIEALEDIQLNYNKRLDNSKKGWHVEFSVNTGSSAFLEKELGKMLDVKIIKEPKKVIDEVGKEDFESGIIKICGHELELKKWNYAGQSLSFNMGEPLPQMKEDSIIKKIDSALEKCIFKHDNVEYGILPLDL